VRYSVFRYFLREADAYGFMAGVALAVFMARYLAPFGELVKLYFHRHINKSKYSLAMRAFDFPLPLQYKACGSAICYGRIHLRWYAVE